MSPELANNAPDFASFAAYLRGLQAGIAAQLNLRSHTAMSVDEWTRPEGGGGRAMMIEDGDVFERAAVNFSHVMGKHLPPSALVNRPELTDKPWQAAGISLVLHPVNPHAPTIHMNLRLFVAQNVWWFGGGIDLTPVYGYEDDARHFHQGLKRVLDGFDAALYPEMKALCDQYFTIKHRKEMRGIGGIFFDDFTRFAYARSAQMLRAIGDAFCGLYLPILDRRCRTPYTPAQVHWQSLRRARYIEFNLVYDRGTHFGLQSNGHINAILLSLPLKATWRYRDALDYPPESHEMRTVHEFLQARDWTRE
ncbi:MAG: Oxygen-dependent coproporphyrinogen-III oxidase [Pseudomonadota bacterium]